MKIDKNHQFGLWTMVMLVAILFPATATAYDFEVDGIFYIASGTTATVTYETSDYNSYSGDIVIPETVTYNGTTYTVTAIGDMAFFNCADLTNVSIPVTVTAIGTKFVQNPGQSFASCTSLTSIVIPDNVECLGRSTFKDCTSLRSVTIGKSIPALKLKKSSITYYAFQGCNNITSLTWNAIECRDMGGMGTTNIEQVTIGPDVQEIPSDFVKESKIDQVTIPNSVTTIGNSAFEACYLIENVTVGNSVVKIGNAAFMGCSALTSIEIPNSTSTVGDNAFLDCSSLESALIGNSVTTIGSQAFSGCSRLQSVVIPDLVTQIGTGAFKGCSSMTSVSIGSSVTDIGDEAFNGCENLTRVNASSIEAWCNIHFGSQDVVFDNELEYEPSNPLYYAGRLYINDQEVMDVVIPNTITAINRFAFNCCINLTSVTIPNSVKRIDNNAFYGCESLTNIEIPNSVAFIGAGAFRDCFGLTNLSLGNSLDTIGLMAFDQCRALTSITIPNSVTYIGGAAFNGCKELSGISIPYSVVNMGSNPFANCPSMTWISVDEGNATYDSRDNCNAIIETATDKLLVGCQITTIPNSITSIAPYAFLGCENLVTLFIPRTVTAIGIETFLNCNSLLSIMVEDGNPVYDSRDNCNAIIETGTNTLILGCMNTVIPNSVTVISESAFDGCTGLTSITIPNSVTSIGGFSFHGCSGLTTVSIGSSVTSIGYNAFANCTGLTNVIIPSSITSINDFAFAGCTSLSSVTIPNSMIVTNPYTASGWFMGCTGLTNVVIGSGMDYMGIMFFNCPNITNVTCLATSPPNTDDLWSQIVDGQKVYLSNFDPEVYEQAVLYVPASSLEAYRTAQYWKDFQSIRPLGDDDGDGALGIADVSSLIDKLLAGDTDIMNSPGADVDGDGQISIADVSALIDLLLNS